MTLKVTKKKSNECYAIDNTPGWKPDKGKKRYLDRKIAEQEANQEIKLYKEQLELFSEDDTQPTRSHIN